MNEDDHDLLHLDNIVMGFIREKTLWLKSTQALQLKNNYILKSICE